MAATDIFSDNPHEILKDLPINPGEKKKLGKNTIIKQAEFLKQVWGEKCAII